MGGIQSHFVVVAGSEAAAIANVAETIAAMDPIRRKVVRPGDADYDYPEAIVASATAGSPNPGVVVFRSDDSVYTVLSVENAQNALVINDAFSQAAA